MGMPIRQLVDFLCLMRYKMKNSASTYITQLGFLQCDLVNIIKSTTEPHNSSFDTVNEEAAKKHAEAIASLIAGQIQELENAAFRLNDANPILLRKELEMLRELMRRPVDQKKLDEYLVMIDSLINDEVEYLVAYRMGLLYLTPH